MTSLSVQLMHALANISWCPVSTWVTPATILIAVKALRLNQRQHQDNEIQPARLVTLIGRAHHQTRSGRLHVNHAVTNDAAGPIVDPRPLVFLQAADGRRTTVEYGLRHTEDHAEHRIVGGDSRRLNLFFPLGPGPGRGRPAGLRTPNEMIFEVVGSLRG